MYIIVYFICFMQRVKLLKRPGVNKSIRSIFTLFEVPFVNSVRTGEFLTGFYGLR